MAAAKKHVLIVEDDQFLVRALTDKLTRSGYEVASAIDGEKGLEAMRKQFPDLILLDLVMPNVNGFQMLEEVRKDPTLKDARVIVLSNLGQQEDIDKAMKLGANDYLVKADVALKDVVAKMESYLKT